MTKTVWHNILCCCGKDQKSETSLLLKIRFQQHREVVARGDTLKSGVAYHVRRRGSTPAFTELGQKHCRIRRSKESANIPCLDNSISKPWIDINSLWEPLFMKPMGTLAKPTGKSWTRCRDQWKTKFGYAYRKTFAYSFGIELEKYVKSRKDPVWIIVKN